MSKSRSSQKDPATAERLRRQRLIMIAGALAVVTAFMYLPGLLAGDPTPAQIGFVDTLVQVCEEESLKRNERLSHRAALDRVKRWRDEGQHPVLVVPEHLGHPHAIVVAAKGEGIELFATDDKGEIVTLEGIPYVLTIR